MDKPERGYFTCEYKNSGVYFTPRAYQKLLDAVEIHIEYVDKNGPSNTCKCAYCDEKRKEEFEELYGGE